MPEKETRTTSFIDKDVDMAERTSKSRRSRSRSASQRSESRDGRGSSDRGSRYETDRSRRRERSRRQHASRSRSRSPYSSSSRRRRSRTPPRRSSRDYSRERRYSSDRSRDRSRRNRATSRRSSHEHSPSTKRDPSPELTQEERDMRTVFVAQLSAQARPRDIREWFEKHETGPVRDVRLIADRGSRRMKGLGYIEFREVESVTKAIALEGQLFMGIPIIVQRTESERNRLHKASSNPSLPPRPASGAVRVETGPLQTLYVTNIPVQMTANHIEEIFKAFGQIDNVRLLKDDNGLSRGLCYVTYQHAADAKAAHQAMVGFSIGGQMLKCTLTSDNKISSTELDDADVKLNRMARAELMAKLARTEPTLAAPVVKPLAPVATRCVLLTDMFNPAEETGANWDREIELDVQEECQNNYGPITHIKVIKESQGHVYIKFATTESAQKAVSGLNGRWFASRQISATFCSESEYHAKFPEATFN